LGPEAKQAVPALKAALRDKDASIRITAAIALTRLNFRGEEATSALVEGVASPDISLHQQAIGTVQTLGESGKAAVPALIRILQDKDERWQRQSAAHALSAIGPSAKAAVPALVEALKDEEPDLRSIALGALGRIGAGDKTLVPILIEALLASGGSFH